jgi:hypothetical protein
VRPTALLACVFAAALLAGCNGPPPDEAAGRQREAVGRGEAPAAGGQVEPSPALGPLRTAAEEAKRKHEAAPDDLRLAREYSAALTLYAQTLENDAAFTTERFRRAWLMYRKAVELDPSNTTAAEQIRMYEQIYATMPERKPPPDEEFTLDLPPLVSEQAER